ncbi:MAG: hypothetical protein IAE89_04365 [Anaerolineae bacterium]|nr:hypothetical protein [Anaerolineae bacterium]
MNQTISQLVKLLTQEGISTADAAKAIGVVKEAGGAHRAMLLTPEDSSFSSAEISPGGAADTPSTVELTFKDSGGLTLKDFEDAYGERHFVPMMRPGQKSRAAFYYEPEDAPYMLAIFVSHDDEHVASVMLRRDKRI